ALPPRYRNQIISHDALGARSGNARNSVCVSPGRCRISRSPRTGASGSVPARASVVSKGVTAMRMFPAFHSIRQRVSRPLSRDKADMLLLLFSCALVLLPHIGHLPAWVFPSCTAILLWRGWLTFHGNRMPPRWILLSVSLLAMGGVFASYQTWFGRDAGV